jgi:hypothetical protein
MIHPHTELRYISPEVGFGVVATQLIPKGTITWVLDQLDREFTPEQVQAMDPVYQNILDTYTYRNSRGNFVLCWDIGRYVNHSFRASCLTTPYEFEVAVRDIHPGEQLTDDYGYLNIPRPFKGIDEGTRRKVVYPDDLLRYHRVWDRKLQSAMRRLHLLHQPLRELVEDATWEKAVRIARREEPMESILSCYYGDEANSRRTAPSARRNGRDKQLAGR